jgi:GNAT superfamily N-acetyltransferase
MVSLDTRPELAWHVAGWMHQAWARHRGECLQSVRETVALRQADAGTLVTWIALSGEVPVGTAALVRAEDAVCAGPFVCLMDLIVEPRVRGRGIGRALCEHVASYVRQQGIGPLCAYTVDGEPFFRHLGWEPVADTVVTMRGEPVRVRLIRHP